MISWKELVCQIYLSASLGHLRIIYARFYKGSGTELLCDFEIKIIMWGFNLNDHEVKAFNSLLKRRNEERKS